MTTGLDCTWRGDAMMQRSFSFQSKFENELDARLELSTLFNCTWDQCKRGASHTQGLSAESGEGYSCAKCNSFYTPLQAMALQDRTADSGSLNFVCKACKEELDFISKSSNSKQDALRRFRLQCRDLLLLTRDLQETCPALYSNTFTQRNAALRVRIHACNVTWFIS